MVADPRFLGILLLGIAGACVVDGAVGLAFPAWEAAHRWQLMMVGASIPWLATARLVARIWREEQESYVRQRNALTDATMVATLEREAKLTAPVPVAAVPVVIRRIPVTDRNGTREIEIEDSRSARWLAWQACVETALDWARIRGSITSGVMVGQRAMFSDRGQWVDVTNVMADERLCEKANGRVTRLTGNADELLERVCFGQCAWPTDRNPPSYSPAPVSVRAESALVG